MYKFCSSLASIHHFFSKTYNYFLKKINKQLKLKNKINLNVKSIKYSVFKIIHIFKKK